MNLNAELLMITDEQRILYKMFNLKKSFKKVWNSDTLIYYAEQLCLKRDLPKSYQDIKDDPHQMGGDFMLQYSSIFNRFKLIYLYRSQNPPDRPTANDLIKFLNENHL